MSKGTEPHAILRFASEEDAPQVAAIYRPIVQSTPISFEIDPPDDATIAKRMADTLESHPWLVCEFAGDIAGYAYAGRHRERPAYRWSVDVAVYVHPAFRRRGVARALYTALVRILALQGYRRAHAGITLPNPSSVGLHEAVGFQSVGVYRSVGFKLGAWRDVGWWQLTLGPPVEVPPEPRPLAEVARDPSLPRLFEESASRVGAHPREEGVS